MEITNADRAKVLVQALPYIQQYYGQTIVIKYGGNAMINEDLKRAVMSDIVLMQLIGINVVLVHGGGPEISGMLKKIGKESRFVNGLRYTDEETIDVVQMVLAGKVNKDPVQLLQQNSGRAVGLCGMDGAMLRAEKMTVSEDLGYVGEIVEVNTEIIEDTTAKGYIPVIATVASGVDGHTYNINADGIISGGMIPKIECCVEAVRRGVSRAHIIDGRIAHSILIELFTDEGIGTMFY